MQEQGVEIREGDLEESEEDLVKALAEIDVVISCVGAPQQQCQIPLANAAKKAGVKRFVPCGFITVAPPAGVMLLRDQVSTVVSLGSETLHLIIDLVCPEERGCVQSHQAALAPVYLHRRWLVVPARISKTSVWADRLCRAQCDE